MMIPIPAARRCGRDGIEAPPKRRVSEVIGMPRVAPQPTVEHLSAIGRLGPEALELIVTHDLEAKPDGEEKNSQAVDGGEGGR